MGKKRKADEAEIAELTYRLLAAEPGWRLSRFALTKPIQWNIPIISIAIGPSTSACKVLLTSALLFDMFRQLY